MTRTQSLKLTCALAFIYFAAGAQVVNPELFYWSVTPDTVSVEKQFAGASAVVLRDYRIFKFSYDDSKEGNLQSEYTVHKIIQINDARALESYNKLYVPLSEVLDVGVIKARTISPLGKVTVLDKDHIKELDNKEGKGAYKIFAFEGLELGGRLEYIYTLKKEVEYSFRISVQSDDPVQMQKVIIISPSNLKYDYKTYNGTSTNLDTVTSEDSKRYTIITSTDVPGKTEEQYSAYAANLMRIEIQLAYNEFKGKARILSYNSAVQRMYPVLYDEDAKAVKAVEKESQRLSFNKYKGEDLIKHIENYIKTSIQEVKASGPDYVDVEKILKNKIANATGILKLYISLCSANGIKCEVVYTTDRSKVAFDADFETWNYLDENVLYFPDYDKYLDPSDLTLRYPFINVNYQLNNGLFVEEVAVGKFKSATGTVKKIPAIDVSKNGEIIDANCKFNKDMDSVYIKLTRSFLGVLATETRFVYNYSEKDNKKKLVDELSKFAMEDAKVISADMKNYDFLDEEKPLEINSEIAGTALIEKTGKDVLFKIGEILGPQSELYQEKERQDPIDMFYAHHYSRTIKLEIPAGYKPTGLEALKMDIKFDLDGKPACGFKSDYKLEGNALTVNIIEYYNVIQLPKTEFENFRKVINAAADFNKVNIVLEKI